MDKPVVYLKTAENLAALEQLEEALSTNGFYQMSGQIVHIYEVRDKQLHRKYAKLPEGYLVIRPVSPVTLRLYADHLVEFKVFRAGTKDWKVAPFPITMAKELTEQGHFHYLPVLKGITEVPCMRPDGSILSKAGYDPVTGLVFRPRGVLFPSVPENPTREDALYALELIKRPFKDYAFTSESHASVAYSALITSCNRRAIPTAPLFAFTAPKQGSGKSLAVDVCSIVATGKTAAVLSLSPSEEENEKRIGATLMQGARIVSFDNLEHPLEGAFLNQCLTQDIVQHRPLGISKTLEIQVTGTFFATGNNLKINGDMVRRTLLCEIDPKCERPFERDFGYDLKDYCLEHRVDIAIATLVLLRAYAVAHDKPRLKPYSSFPEWDRLVRHALVWAGCADPVDTMEDVITSDDVGTTLAEILEALYEHFGNQEFKVGEVMAAANAMQRQFSGESYENVRLHDAIGELGVRGEVTAKQLGKYFARYQKRMERGLKIVKTRAIEGYQRWAVVADDKRKRDSEVF